MPDSAALSATRASYLSPPPVDAPTLAVLRARYESVDLDVRTLAEQVADRLIPSDPAWIHVESRAALRTRAEGIAKRFAGMPAGSRPALYGIPFAVKDNIDVAGVPTTAACAAFAYTPAASAFAVGQLEEAGALFVGKTNLDQFATGLVGTRSPYGAVDNAFDARYISGGSSSGSASVVARGLVSFALGTDTAGSGRVPAAFNNLVGIKPTRGLVSTRGVVPACRSLDCISIFALTVADATQVLDVAGRFDAVDPFARRPQRSGRGPLRVVGIPRELEFAGDMRAARAFEEATSRLAALGVTTRTVDLAPFLEAARLLYEGPWVAERLAVVEELLARDASAFDLVVREVIERGREHSAVQAFRAQYRLAEIARVAEATFEDVDALFVPTTPTIYSKADIAADPIGRNATLGHYTNFVNLLDGCALALPAGFRDDGLPAGITLIAPAWCDAELAAFGAAWQRALDPPLGATGKTASAEDRAAALPPRLADTVEVAVVGAHLSGMPLNRELVERGARLVDATTTEASYALYALPDTRPPKPGLVRRKRGEGAAIAVEVWSMPVARFGDFVAGIPPPLGIGSVALAGGREVKGFICEPGALEGARDITSHGGWRAYLASTS